LRVVQCNMSTIVADSLCLQCHLVASFLQIFWAMKTKVSSPDVANIIMCSLTCSSAREVPLKLWKGLIIVVL
jgi:hypothetical protein